MKACAAEVAEVCGIYDLLAAFWAFDHLILTVGDNAEVLTFRYVAS